MRLRLVILFSALCSYCMAKDVIVTNDAKQIDAKIVEVSESEVKYKKMSNPNGPTFVITTDKLSAVVYENGEIQTFHPVKAEVTLQAEQLVEVAEGKNETKPVSGNVASHPKIFYSRITLPNGKRRWRYHNEDNTLIMKNSEFESYLAAHCPAAHAQLRKSHSTSLVAIFMDFIFLPAGMVLAVVSSVQSDKVLPIYNEKCAGE